MYARTSFRGAKTCKILGTIFAKAAGGPGGRFRPRGGVQRQSPGGVPGGEGPQNTQILAILMHSGTSK